MNCPVVTTSLGQVKGIAIPKANDEEAKQVFAYFGIPFAKPPVGNLRFKNPEKVEPWNNVLDASKSPAEPMASAAFIGPLMDYATVPVLDNEDLANMSEDCLYLNVYTNNPDKKAYLPVIFWIYGGGFSFGGTIGYNGQALCGLNEVVLVVPQYRVNVFGFYSLGKESSCKGNMGLQDQILALKWVKDHINNFGGNPDNVTIYGESAGGISVTRITEFPFCHPNHVVYFIAPSVKAELQQWKVAMINADLSAQRKVLHEQLKITATDPEYILKQLREMDAETIIKAIDAEPFRTMFTPTLDDVVIPKHPNEMLKDGNFAPVPYILGMNNTEGFGLFALQMPPKFAEGLDKQTCVSSMRASLAMGMPPDKLEEIIEVILEILDEEYEDTDPFKWSKILGSITGDKSFVIPSIGQALAHSGGGHPTFVYYMTQQLKMHHDDEYAGKLKKKHPFCEADHGDDVVFTFGYPLINSKFTSDGFKYSDDERRLSKQWMKSLCSFAKTGNPNGDCGDTVQWPQYDCEKKRHLVMKMPYAEGSDLVPKRCKLWLETIPSILKK